MRAATMSDDLFPGFESTGSTPRRAHLRAIAGRRPPLVLLHGFPQTHVMWHRLAPTLAEPTGRVHGPARLWLVQRAERRCDARDLFEARHGPRRRRRHGGLGHVRFAVVGHDRGARVGYRLALDHPGRVERLALLDILPTCHVWDQMKAGTIPAAHWGFPLAALSRSPKRRSVAIRFPISKD